MYNVMWEWEWRNVFIMMGKVPVGVIGLSFLCRLCWNSSSSILYNIRMWGLSWVLQGCFNTKFKIVRCRVFSRMF